MKKIIMIVILLFMCIGFESISAQCTYTYIGTHFKNSDKFGRSEMNNAGVGATLSFDVDTKKGRVTKRADNKLLWFIDMSYSFGGEATISSWQESHCPMYIAIKNNETDWKAFEQKPDVNESFSSVENGSRVSLFMNDNPDLPTYECTYEGFKILFDYDGKAISVLDTLSNSGITFSYDLDSSLTEQPAVEPGKCENVYTCVTTSAPAVSDPNTGMYSPAYQGYTVFSGSIDVSEKKESVCLDSIMTLFDYQIDEEISDEGGDNSACRTFSTRWQILKDYYVPCSQKKVLYCKLYNEYKNKMKQWCSSITKFINYGDACLDKCLTLKDEISKLENKDGSNKKCGFSERLLIWIGNIVRWMKYIVPVIVIVLGILDFIKAMASSKEDEMKKAQKNFTIRLIAAALIFISPFIIEFILDKMGFTVNGCGIIDL